MDDFVLYLDENLDSCKAIKEVLDDLNVKYERHQAHFPRGTADETWLALVAQKSWYVLTKDKRNRFNDLERQVIVESGVREFYFAAGNLSGSDMGRALRIALPVMRKTASEHRPPFVASVSRTGTVTVLFDRGGSTHERRQPSRSRKLRL